MAYIIAQPCIGTKDTACVVVCPVDCIHPKKDEPAHAEEERAFRVHVLRQVAGSSPNARSSPPAGFSYSAS